MIAFDKSDMKKALTYFMSIQLAMLLTSCEGTNADQHSKAGKTNNPLVGTWLLIDGKYYTADRDSLLWETHSPAQPTQIRIFSADHFAYVSRSADSSLAPGSAGPYKIEGDTYIETHAVSGGKKYVGATSTYRFRISGDTLFTTDPLRSVYASGQKITDHFQMDEIRIRAKPE